MSQSKVKLRISRQLLCGRKKNQHSNPIFVQCDCLTILGLCNHLSITRKLGLKI